VVQFDSFPLSTSVNLRRKRKTASVRAAGDQTVTANPGCPNMQQVEQLLVRDRLLQISRGLSTLAQTQG